ncbi:uncharacterized protein LOC120421016 isoform X1 [Culex pipiens pallens]|uniref:uncharacterized protein LOC120421016 isoform X1 n=1 Tax=Culex pipiens pallens TaxID=42434 RepID=UPI001952E1E6|nr:uncharacterized protein LOC120421016 isoform X1 [Culex pipiens pallens]
MDLRKRKWTGSKINRVSANMCESMFENTMHHVFGWPQTKRRGKLLRKAIQLKLQLAFIARHRIETETEKKNTMLAWWCSTRVKRPAAECYAETLQKGCPEICPRIALSQGHPLVNDWSDRLRSATM